MRVSEILREENFNEEKFFIDQIVDLDAQAEKAWEAADEKYGKRGYKAAIKRAEDIDRKAKELDNRNSDLVSKYKGMQGQFSEDDWDSGLENAGDWLAGMGKNTSRYLKAAEYWKSVVDSAQFMQDSGEF